MKIILLGPPGAGKGTLAATIKDYFSIPHISTGDLFRYHIQNKTELGIKVKEIIDSGNLVPDSATVQMVKERIAMEDCKDGFILDGFPRTIPQAESLEKLSDIDVVVNLSISDEEVVLRLSGRRICPSNGNIYHVVFNPPKKEGFDDESGEPLIQRDDDKEESIRNRLSVYHAQTAPLIDFYTNKGIIKNVMTSNSKTKQEVFDETIKAITK